MSLFAVVVIDSLLTILFRAWAYERARVEAHDVAIGWSHDRHLFDHATFAVERGEIFGILGRSASGKSTMLRALVGLEPPRGEISSSDARPLATEPPEFGVMFQHGALFGSLTVGENIALPLETWTDLPRDAIRAVVAAKLRLVGLAGRADLMPPHFQAGCESAPQWRARSYSNRPLVFLDEPSSGLDPVTSAEIDGSSNTSRRHSDLTVVLISHELGSIQAIVDRCILLDRETKGILATGTPDELAAARPSRAPLLCAYRRIHEGRISQTSSSVCLQYWSCVRSSL